VRRFYTTGVWACAAAKAAVSALFTGIPPSEVDVPLPVGGRVRLPVVSVVGSGWAISFGVKESPEAEDVTHGAVMGARATPFEGGVLVEAGCGVGVITKRGLKLPVGEPAVNPVPRYFILKSIGEVLEGLDAGVRVELFVPSGESIARKTVNPKLGIVGGISILGTRGTVVPFSAKSFMDSILAELSVAFASGNREVVLAPGRESLEFAMERVPLPEEAFVAIGDHVYFAVRHAARIGFSRIRFFAQPGKMAKVACGFKNTHAKRGSLPMGWLSEVLGLDVGRCNTVREAFEDPRVAERWWRVEEIARKRLAEYSGVEVEVFTVPYS